MCRTNTLGPQATSSILVWICTECSPTTGAELQLLVKRHNNGWRTGMLLKPEHQQRDQKMFYGIIQK
jgi:hypothetical protein